MAEEKVRCRTHTSGPDGGTNIPAWKFEAMRHAIFEVLADGPMKVADMKEAVRSHLTKDELDNLGALGWHMTTIRLELEVRGDLKRLEGSPVFVALP